MPFAHLAPHAAAHSWWKHRLIPGDQEAVAEVELAEETQKEVEVGESSWKKWGGVVTWHALHHCHHQVMSGSPASWMNQGLGSLGPPVYLHKQKEHWCNKSLISHHRTDQHEVVWLLFILKTTSSQASYAWYLLKELLSYQNPMGKSWKTNSWTFNAHVIWKTMITYLSCTRL